MLFAANFGVWENIGVGPVPEFTEQVWHKTKKPRQCEAFKYIVYETELFLSAVHVFLVSVHELINASCSINKLHFSSIKWM